MNCSPCLWYTGWKGMAPNGSRMFPVRHWLCFLTCKSCEALKWLRETGISSLEILNVKLNKHLSGDESCFREDTRLRDLPRFLLGLFSYDCMHNKSDISPKFPIAVHKQTICAKQSQYAWCFLEAFYLLKQKCNSSTHLYKRLSRATGKKVW